MSTRCDVCAAPEVAAQLAPFAKADGTTGRVHLAPGSCMAVLAAGLPDPGPDDPPVVFTAARIRMDRLAEMTGRPTPTVRAVRHDESGVWHWVDDSG